MVYAAADRLKIRIAKSKKANNKISAGAIVHIPEAKSHVHGPNTPCTWGCWSGICSRLELSNNRAERSIRPFVIDRKNFLFANTPSGTRSSAVIFSLIQTAAENGLDPCRYLAWLLSSAAEMNLAQPDVVQSLLPRNAPASCKTK